MSCMLWSCGYFFPSLGEAANSENRPKKKKTMDETRRTTACSVHKSLASFPFTVLSSPVSYRSSVARSLASFRDELLGLGVEAPKIGAWQTRKMEGSLMPGRYVSLGAVHIVGVASPGPHPAPAPFLPSLSFTTASARTCVRLSPVFYTKMTLQNVEAFILPPKIGGTGPHNKNKQK